MSNEYCTCEKRETKDMTTLDKIKAEVADQSYLSYDGNPRHIIDESWVFEIIDKYAEQEDMTTLDKIRVEIEQNAYPIVHGVNNHEKGMTLYGILQVIDKYRNLPKPLEQGWIPISETPFEDRKYPKERFLEDGYVEPSDAVLLQRVDGTMCVSRYWGNRRSKASDEASCRGPEYCDWVDAELWDDEVLAWMPLPESYKKDKKEDLT